MNRDRRARREALKRREEAKVTGNWPVTRRGLFLMGAQLAFGLVLAYRMRQLQVVETERYRLLAEENRINIHLIPPVRAEIFDRNGLPLAVNAQNYRVVMIREQAGDVEAMLDQLSLIIDIPENRRRRVLKEMRQKSSFVPVAVAEHLDWHDFAEVNVNIPSLAGVQAEVGLTRNYPHGELTAHIIGYVSRVTEKDLEIQEIANPVLQIPGFQIGKTGIERALEDELRGGAGTRRIEVNALGRVIREIDRVDGIHGADLHLTLDLGMQTYVRERLEQESAAVVVMDVNNGDLVALASNPTYDPNLFVRGIPVEDWDQLLNNDHRPLANKWASGMYPPGSTFKMMVALAALEAGLVSPGERVFCNGALKLGNRKFHCWRRGGHGHVHLRQSLEQSCDVFFYEMAKRLGIDTIAKMALRFGLGSAADIPIPAIKGGLIPTRDWKVRSYEEAWQTGDSLNSAIGQGFVLATPLQLAVMTARIASGREVQPRLIRARGGVPVPVPEPAELGLRAEHLALVRGGMFDVVNAKRGTARRSRIADDVYAMAGKTGTSQVRNITASERAAGVTSNKDLPWSRRDHALFVCYAPFDKPKYAVSVIVEHGGGGSAVAAPIARDVMMRALYGSEVPAEAYPPGQRPAQPPRPRPENVEPAEPRVRT
ncbi:MAG TPA: penicillin-binding protein 2 [Thermohalobaculum sp.]|nr:penicillin-binding protein 2 [Thermohalobaculum sp.]